MCFDEIQFQTLDVLTFPLRYPKVKENKFLGREVDISAAWFVCGVELILQL